MPLIQTRSLDSIWWTWFPPTRLPPGYLPVLRAYDYAGDPVSLVHADDIRLRRMAVFDVLVNNADRKGGHVLRGVDGDVYGVDHGLCLHVEDKLRTVLWGWAGKPLDDKTLEKVSCLVDALAGSLGEAWPSTSPAPRSQLCGCVRACC